MQRSVGTTSCPSASSFRQRLLVAWSQLARPSCADLLGGARRIPDEKAMLHVGNRLAANVQLGRDGGGITLVGDRDPVVAREPSPGEPGFKLPPPGCLVGTLAFDPPAKAGAAVEPGIVVDAHDAQMLEPAARKTEQQPIHGRLVLWQVDCQVQRRKGVSNAAIGALRTAHVIQECGADRGKTIDELRNQHAATVGELLAPKPVDRKAQEM